MSSAMGGLNDLLIHLAKSTGSDLHICAGTAPMIRVNGKLQPAFEDAKPLDYKDIDAMLFQLLTQEQQAKLLKDRELDFSVSISEVGRFRANVHRQRGTWAAAFRKIPFTIPDMKELGLPEAARALALKESGLVLITGPTGSGKSMTLASMVETINAERSCHIICLEDPIEFLFHNKKAIIKQRELGSDTENYHTALHHIFRQDPDVIMVGEMRDSETISMAITAASTGRLVMGTMHTMDATATIDRLVESFPADQQNLVRGQVAGILEGIISQQLIVRADGKGRVLGVEVLVSTPSVRNLVRSGKTFQIQSDIEVGKRFGMQSMNQSLQAYITAGTIKLEEAIRHTRFPDALLQKLGVPQ